MHAKQELPIDASLPPAPVGARNRHGTPVSPLSDVAGKYALLLKYSDKARAAELRLSSFPDDLRERFRQEAVAEPAHISEIAARLAAEERKRSSLFGDPKLDTLHRKLGSYGPDAQSEFQQVVELLKGEVDPERVFTQIIGRMDRRSSSREGASVVQLIETPQAMEQRRRRAEEIAGEIENLRRVSESRYLLAEPGAPAKVDLPRVSVANSNCRGETVEPATNEQDRPAVASSAVVRDESAAEPATVPTIAVPAMPEPPRLMLAVASVSVKPPHWAPALAAAAVVAAVMSGVGLALTVPPTGAAVLAQRPAATDTPRQMTQQEATMHGAATRAAEAVATAPGAAEEKARAEEAGKKAAAQKLAAEAAVRREEEIRQARSDEDKAQVEAARQMAEAEGRSAAQEAERRQVAESDPKPETGTRQQTEKAEAGLNLSERDHKRVQVALTALGHQTPATGYFGPITRAMIADWQKAQGLPPSGFLNSLQLATLYAQTPPAAFDAGQKKLDAQQVEAGLNLSERDHKRVQVALTALGHQTPATGYFGPITRAMIADWQKTQGLPPSGFLNSSQLAALYAQTAPSLPVSDQRKVPEPRGAM